MKFVRLCRPLPQVRRAPQGARGLKSVICLIEHIHELVAPRKGRVD